MASRNGKKSSGLRMLWIPGGRKSHPKGRFDSTNKKISYSTRQKKSEVWSLGGSKAQKDLLEADPDISLLDGPSTSGLSSLACATAAATGATAVAAATSAQCLESHNSPDTTSESSTYNHQQQHSPTTPNSSTSTAPLISPPQSPLEQTLQLSNSNTTQPSITSNTTTTMPAKSHQPIPVIVTTTTTAEIMEENRFSLLAGKDIVTNELDIYTLPSPPTNDLNSQENLNNSSGTTVSQITPSGSPHKMNNGSQNGSVSNTPVKKKHQNRNHNNNQGDVNSIESITEDTVSEKIPTANLDWIDAVVQERQDREILAKPKKKKKKKHAKELDQLDGVPMKENSTDASLKDEDDEKVVKCLYYTLMCCDCTIS
ncbi:mucin-2 isoform X2 [Calliphora vicina]|uniref:mucin-2 isoform X2 n=1 Tax=Calliphora vicina TaxID=7373 RepID=UPI00325B0424